MTTILESIIDRFPEGLDQTVIRILMRHQGRENKITRKDLLRAINVSGFPKVDDRSLRALINVLRKSGEMICSAGGTNGGYWLAADYAELDEFIQRELHPRAMDLLEQEKALTTSGRERWGSNLQPRMM